MRVGGVVSASVLLLGAVTVAAGSATPSSANRATAYPAAVVAAAPVASRDTAVGLVDPPERTAATFRSPTASAPAGAPPAAPGAPAANILVGALGIPDLVLQAYRAAEALTATTIPGCRLPWHLLAAIGRIESGHAGGGRTDVTGTTLTPVLGPPLDGRSAADAVITDTDGGALDGNSTHDRAVGPMQFIPSTWAAYATDGNGDGKSDPNNVFDAAAAAGKYLCSGGLDMTKAADATAAVMRYNNSAAYTANVLSWSAAYSGGASPVPGRIGDPTPIPSPVDALAIAAAAPGAADVAPSTDPSTTSALPTTLAPVTTTTPPPAFGIEGLPPLPTFELPTIPCLLCSPAPPAQTVTAPAVTDSTAPTP
ncbi:lytic transglycosylase domain-containing protein [Rhodococcoides corynebacterioides]|uniref:Lytic transglycosylase domain-containing protein n=1 Tax=Rhodococcoides corynebacterioides TaxID=53972 RepID=A0ABS7NZT9_9NOCA|nr:lytic transglycosylase domain-containing protein [Rhodococcus corynebacterioides]MBY6365673.1 lytic transglycosylase domain-containing protein [Rhodococcus corynebacterioides]MBY6406404.1 lytic transglycosylase domain-containing protein [Rhodococcus corynebacterioides]